MNALRILVLACLPHHLLSRLTLRLTRLRTRLKDPVVRWFIRHYGVDMDEAAEPDPTRYASFNEFFTRALRAGARPLAGDDRTLACPVDGRVSQAGDITAGSLIQAKGIDYCTERLLGGPRAAAPFADGSFATLYLAPGDYHRIHMPLAGELRYMTHIPGRLFSVAPWTVTSLPGLFTRNERVCAVFETHHGPMALVLVGAINVAAIETVWAGVVTPPTGRAMTTRDYADGEPVRLERGAEAGRFNMGSTVILLLGRRIDWAADARPGQRVRMGQALGMLPSRASVL